MNTMLDTLSKIVHAKIQAGELLLDANPVKQVSSFHALSLSLKVLCYLGMLASALVLTSS